MKVSKDKSQFMARKFRFRLIVTVFFTVILMKCFFIGMHFRVFNKNSAKDVNVIHREIPEDSLYRSIIEVDKETHFLDPSVRVFLVRTRHLTLPSRYDVLFLDTLLEFDRIWREELNRTYMLYGGTLLGAIRQGDRTPWDYTLDVLVDVEYEEIYSFTDDFSYSNLDVDVGHVFSSYSLTLRTTPTGEFMPTIRVSFFSRDTTKIRIEDTGKEVEIEYVFPVSEIAFMGHKFLAPHCPRASLEQTHPGHSVETCVFDYIDADLNFTRSSSVIQCSKLHKLFQFAEYRRINETHMQQMVSKAVPPERLAEQKPESEIWSKGATLRTTMC